jgi:hypothetical protein
MYIKRMAMQSMNFILLDRESNFLALMFYLRPKRLFFNKKRLISLLAKVHARLMEPPMPIVIIAVQGPNVIIL